MGPKRLGPNQYESVYFLSTISVGEFEIACVISVVTKFGLKVDGNGSSIMEALLLWKFALWNGSFWAHWKLPLFLKLYDPSH